MDAVWITPIPNANAKTGRWLSAANLAAIGLPYGRTIGRAYCLATGIAATVHAPGLRRLSVCESDNLADAYNHRMFTAFFQEEQDIGQIVVLTNLAAEIGLDPAAFRQALEKRIYKDAAPGGAAARRRRS